MKNLLLKIKYYYILFFIPFTVFSSSNSLVLDCINLAEGTRIPQNIENLLKTTTISPKVQELIEEIKNKSNSLKLVLVPDQLALTKGNYCEETKTIHIRESIMNEPLKFCEVLLWEMCNSVNNSLNYPIEFSRNRDEYAFFTEAAEHKSLIRRTDILIDYFESVRETKIGSLIETTAQSSLTNIINKLRDDTCMSFQGYWKSTNELNKNDTTTHSDHYRNFFDAYTIAYPARKYSEVFNEEALGLIRYAFKEWKKEENIHLMSNDKRIYYENLIQENKF